MDQGRPVPPKAEPPVKVVGFHVEGATPSPRPSSLREALKTGSMSPVMIPPSFQAPSGRTPELSPRHAGTPTAAASTPPPGLPGPPGRRSSQDANRSPKAAATPQTSSAPAAVAALSTAAASISPRGSTSEGTEASTGVAAPAAAPAAATEQKASTPEKSASSSQQQQKQQGGGRPQQKEMTKAERRALQEAQRAAKAAAKAGQGGQQQLQKSPSGGALTRQTTLDSRDGSAAGGKPQRGGSASQKGENTAAAAGQASKQQQQQQLSSKPTALFAHLPQFRSVTVESVAQRAAAAAVPIECVRLGLQMADGTIRGAHARCEAMLDMFAAAIKSFTTPPGKVFAREFGSALNAMVAFLVSCRPLSPAMGNVIKAIKAELGRIGANPSVTDGDAKAALLSYVATFTQEKVRFAREALARQAAARIAPGDVILTYARSSTVEAVLLAAAAEGTKFSVVVVDSRPLLEGRALLRKLLQAGIPCEYVFINGMMPALSNATKVMLGAGAVLSNGAVLSRVGTAAVAMSAAAAHVPVMVCSETYKFHDRVQLDSVTYNELGDPKALLEGSQMVNNNALTENDNLSLLNLEYDTTPAEYVTVVVTEVGVLPPTSVPVVLREYRRDESSVV